MNFLRSLKAKDFTISNRHIWSMNGFTVSDLQGDYYLSSFELSGRYDKIGELKKDIIAYLKA